MHDDAAPGPAPLCQIIYSVSPDGVILALSESSWIAFAAANDGQLLAATAVIGRVLFEFIDGVEVVASYKAFHEVLLQGLSEEISFSCACDSPDRRRVNHIRIQRSLGPSGLTLRYTSSILSESPREPVAGPWGRARGDESSCALKVCTYCQQVSLPPGQTDGVWLSLEYYQRHGGPVQGTVSHGICPSCRTDIVEPQIARLRDARKP